jgi:hypothetical protein
MIQQEVGRYKLKATAEDEAESNPNNAFDQNSNQGVQVIQEPLSEESFHSSS